MLPKRIKNRVWCHITVVPDTLDAEAEALVVPKGAEAAWETVRILALRKEV